MAQLWLFLGPQRSCWTAWSTRTGRRSNTWATPRPSCRSSCTPCCGGGSRSANQWRALERQDRENPVYLAVVEREVAERGPVAFTELSDPARRERVPTR